MGVLHAGERGQATVEAAFLIPVLFTVLLLSVQPGMVLYDRIVMQAAASDACRLAAVKTDAVGDSSQAVEAFVRHRLGAIPPVPLLSRARGRLQLEGVRARGRAFREGEREGCRQGQAAAVFGRGRRAARYDGRRWAVDGEGPLRAGDAARVGCGQPAGA